MVKKYAFAALAVTLALCVTPRAMAHDESDVHDQVHDALDAQHQEIHQLVNQGLISPQEHAAMDARLRNEHREVHNELNGNNATFGYDNQNNGYSSGYGYGNNGYPSGYGYGNNAYSNGYGYNNGNRRWNQHRRIHQQISADHRDIHNLVNQGVISPQEHAALDAQLHNEHQQADNNLNQNLNFAEHGRRSW